MNTLLNYEIVYIKNSASSTFFGCPYRIVDEGSFFRLDELHIIQKNNVVNEKIDKKRAVITYVNGKVIEVGLGNHF